MTNEHVHPLIQEALAPFSPKFEETHCSQCGQEFGPGDHGYSDCRSHRGATAATSAYLNRRPRSEAEAIRELELAHDGPLPAGARGAAYREGEARRQYDREHPAETLLNSIATLDASIRAGLAHAAELKARAGNAALNDAVRQAAARERREALQGTVEAAKQLSERWLQLWSLLGDAVDEAAAE
jgi:uncharacterized protein (DUF1800 family)